MNDFGIPIVEPTVDLTKVPPIHQKRTITFVNHFIIHTVTFLNKFALRCEEKLFEFENKLQRVEASLEILESRLSSIPNTDLSTKSASAISAEANNHLDIDDVKSKMPEIVENSQVEPNEEMIANSGMQPVIQDPKYAKYFKMVQFGVPTQAVKLKMQQEGLDSLMLDNPDRMVPINETMEANKSTEDG